MGLPLSLSVDRESEYINGGIHGQSLLETGPSRRLDRDTGLLADLGTINAVKLWLEPFKFVGMALLLMGIGLALATIVRVLRWQSARLWDVLK